MTGRFDVATLPSLTVAGRADRVRTALASAGLAGLVASSPSSIRWLTGFTGSAGIVVITADRVVLVTDARYGEQAPEELAAAECPGQAVITSHEQGRAVATALADADSVGLEADHVSWAKAEQIRDDWLNGGPQVKPTTGLITGLRAIKDEGEVARIGAAAAITDAALRAVGKHLRPGTTERQFAGLLDAEIRARGADDVAFETIVASGPNSARPHHHPGERAFSAGDLVIVDVGARVQGYRSDMTRTFGIGDLTADQHDMYDVVIDAQQAGVAAVRANIDAKEIDRACRSLITSRGRGDEFVHGTGHGVGLDIHELPRIGAKVPDRLVAGHVITVEPGVYVPGVGGVRIEDCVHVGETSGSRLTRSPKHLDPHMLADS